MGIPDMARRADERVTPPGTETAAGRVAAAVGNERTEETPSVATERPPDVLVTDPADPPAVAAAVGQTALVGRDTETTALDPRTGRVRLLSLAGDGRDGPCTDLIDGVAVNPSPLCSPRPLWSAARFGLLPSRCSRTRDAVFRVTEDGVRGGLVGHDP